MSDKKPERKKYSSRAAAERASDSVGSVNLEEASSTNMQQDSMKTETSSPPPDYQTFTENVTYTLNRVMETLSIVNDRLENLEQRKASPAPSESENSGRIKENEVQAPEDSEGSKPSSTGFAERIFERRIKSSEGRRRRYSTLENLVNIQGEDFTSTKTVRMKSSVLDPEAKPKRINLIEQEIQETGEDIQRVKV